MTKNRRHDIVKPSKFKTSMCTFFLSAEGCPFGDKCAFAHGEAELRAEPKDGAAATSPARQQENAIATSSPTSSHDSERDETSGAVGEKPSKSNSCSKHGHQDPKNSNNAKRKAKKNKLDAPTNSIDATVVSTHTIPGGRSDATHAQRRLQRERRSLPPPPPIQSKGPMPSAAYNLSVAQPAPTAYALYGDLSMAYGGIPAMPGMPYYIPTVGNHPFSNINNNHHAINVAPRIQGQMAYATASGLPQSTFPAQLSHVAPPPQGSMPNSSMPLNQKLPGKNNTNNNSSTNDNSTSLGEDAKRRPRQAMRHVVSSNMMAHTHGRHASNTASAPPAEVATPQYVYGLMAAAGVLLNGSSVPDAATTTSASVAVRSDSEPRKGGEVSSMPSAPLHPQQPQLIVVPDKSGYGGFIVPSNVKNYHPQATVESTSPLQANGVVSSVLTPVSATQQQQQGAPSSRVDTPPAASFSTRVPTGNFGADDVATAHRSSAFQQMKASPVPPTFVHIPLDNNRNCNNSIGANNTQTSSEPLAISGRTVGDALWGPASGSPNPLTAVTLPQSADEVSGGDYNALLSGLGIGGSSYTTIPLEELVRQRGMTRDDDDVSFGGDFDWTGALERWLHTAKEESAAATTAPTPAVAVVATVAEEEKPTPSSTSASMKAAVPTAATSTAAYLPQATHSVTSVLNHKPLLIEGEAKPKMTTATGAVEGKRKPTVVCQVSRAGGKPVPPRRRAPVMTNQFKSSCTAEAESDSVLLYCAEKNTLVYITSTNGAKSATANAAAAASAVDVNASKSCSVPSNGQSNGTVTMAAEAAHVCTVTPESPNTAVGSFDLGLDVRFNPGRKKHSVLAPEEFEEDNAEYCI